MNGPIKLAVPLLAALAIAACNAGGTSTMPGAPGQSSAQANHVPQWEATHAARRACGEAVRPGYARCDALIINDRAIRPDVAGWGPIDFQTRYNLPSGTNGAGQIVAIVDAYDNPNAASDLSTYRTNFGLGTANFTKYNQNGQTSGYPSGDRNWGLEEDLDIQMVSAVCPKCTIYLIEANGADQSDLQTAEKTAVTLGAHIVSNSWGCFGSNNCVDSSDFDTPGVVYLASAGDSGYGTQGPAALASVVSVGGTVMSKSGSTYSETTWNGTGAGCATGITKPSWQHDSGCTYRTMNDIAAVAWQAAEYDSYGYGGWITVGGTSVASPMMGGVFGLAGNASSLDAGKKFWTLKKRKRKKELHDITTGSDGSCGGSYLCTAGVGYDGPTGWGTPNGIKAF
ncbi:MAG: peptidase S8 [Candidatus Eremiobacteraeota bacterium]|nr:peptidase S8 [Candidatus Eremiobacteraeota bacterium]